MNRLQSMPSAKVALAMMMFSVCSITLAQTPLDNHFTYQGQIKKDGSPFTGSCNFTFSLYAFETGGSAIGSPFNAAGVPVAGGLFTAQLEFAANAFNGEKRWLEIQAQCPAVGGSMTTLSPRQELTAAPYAAYALQALWSGLTGVPAGFADGVDNDTQYTAGTGLTLTGTQFNVNTAAIQQRVGSSCAEGSAIRVINPDGTVTCQTSGTGGGVTAVTASAPLSSSGGSTPNISLTGTIADSNLAPITTAGKVANTATTATYANAGGAIVARDASGDFSARIITANLTGTATNATNATTAANFSGSLGGDVTGAQGATSVVRLQGRNLAATAPYVGEVIKWDGTQWAPGTDNSAITFWSLDGNGLTNPAVNFLGTTDNRALEIRVNNTRALRIEPNATSPNIIGGYSGNGITSGVAGGTISGGGSSLTSCGPLGNQLCSNQVTDDYGTTAGGIGNRAGDNTGTTSDQPFATVGGGEENIASGDRATVGGGRENTANGRGATVSGGVYNTASGDRTTVGGGIENTASGHYSTVPGGRYNLAQGDYSFAAGRRARAGGAGSFVWSDSSDSDTWSFSANEFVARATGGFYFYTGTNPTTGARLMAGSGTWSDLSDRNAKTDVTPVDSRKIVAKLAQMPLATWRYKAQREGIRHMGPMAQDFHAAFGLGEDEKYISTIDADGVALAAIQGVYQELKDRDAKIATLEARLTELEQVLKQLAVGQKER